MSSAVVSTIFLLATALVILSGCTNPSLEQKTERGKKAAIAAIESSEAWERIRGEHLTRGPYQIDATRVGHHFYDAQVDTVAYRHGEPLVIFTVPTGVYFGMHSTFVDVTVRRDTSEVLYMREYYYP